MKFFKLFNKSNILKFGIRNFYHANNRNFLNVKVINFSLVSFFSFLCRHAWDNFE